ncbi:hypothetical protein V8C26DRAFT_394780 [Trichoderma gracile]
MTGSSTLSKEAVEIAMGGPARQLLTSCSSLQHTLALACQRVAPTAARAVSVEHLRAFPLTLVSRLEPGRAGHESPFATCAASFWFRYGGSRRSLLRCVQYSYARPYSAEQGRGALPVLRQLVLRTGGELLDGPGRALGLLEALLKRNATIRRAER